MISDNISVTIIRDVLVSAADHEGQSVGVVAILAGETHPAESIPGSEEVTVLFPHRTAGTIRVRILPGEYILNPPQL